MTEAQDQVTYEAVNYEHLRGSRMDFGTALKVMEAGYAVARTGWNGKGMWVALMPGLYLEADKVNGRTKHFLGEGQALDSQPYFTMWTATGQWQPGWLASAADILAKDWVIVKTPN